MVEKYYNISPYAYCANNPIRFIDPTGMQSVSSEEWGDDKMPIDVKWRMFNRKYGYFYEILDNITAFHESTEKTDGNKTNVLPEVVVIASSNENSDDFSSVGGVFYFATRPIKPGEYRNDMTISHLPLPGTGSWKNIWQSIKSLKNVGSLFKAKNSANSIKDLINSAGKLQRLKHGVRQGTIKGDINKIFNDLAKSNKAIIQNNGKEQYFINGSMRVGIHTSTKGVAPTIHIKDLNTNQLYKIRVTP